MSPAPAASGGRGGPGGRPRPPRRQVEVRSVQRLTPRMVRIRVVGPELAEFAGSHGPGGHLKLFVPVDGGAETAMRTYTPRNLDPDAGELDIDFVLHGDGPAARWAADARPGDRAAVAGARGGFAVDEGAAWVLLAGDESALPAISDIVAALPAGVPATVLIEVADAAERQPLPTSADVDLRWLLRSDGAELVEAVRQLPLPAGTGQAWIGCEAAAMRAIRRHLLDGGSVPRQLLETRGYWLKGESGHPDHDFGEDADGKDVR